MRPGAGCCTVTPAREPSAALTLAYCASAIIQTRVGWSPRLPAIVALTCTVGMLRAAARALTVAGVSVLGRASISRTGPALASTLQSGAKVAPRLPDAVK